jgi:hypothetical protein
MKNCPRCSKCWSKSIGGSNNICDDCQMFYYPSSNILDWKIVFEAEDTVCFISWYFDKNECYITFANNITQNVVSNEILLPRMLPFDISLEQIEKYLLLV